MGGERHLLAVRANFHFLSMAGIPCLVTHMGNAGTDEVHAPVAAASPSHAFTPTHIHTYIQRDALLLFAVRAMLLLH